MNVEMNKKLDHYINELQHDLKDHENIEDEWIYEISEQYSQYSWYGLESVGIEKVLLNDGSIHFLVNHESATELVKQSANDDQIIDTLTNLKHDSGDKTLIAIFDTHMIL